MRDEFGDRMKEYERCYDSVLPHRIPMIIRLDGNSFSKLTVKQGYKKPFDPKFASAMANAARAAVNYISDGVIAYVQSDEISILVYSDNDRAHQFLAGRVQKLCSLLACTTANAFNKKTGLDATFDCRVFVLPPCEVNNYFLWRQKDSFKNCVSSYCVHSGVKRADKLVHGLSTNERQEWLFKYKNINVNDLPAWQRRGYCIRRVKTEVPLKDVLPKHEIALIEYEMGSVPDTTVIRQPWMVDTEIPLFSADLEYISTGGHFREPLWNG